MIDKDLVFLEANCQNRSEVLSLIANESIALGYVESKEEFVKAIMNREEMIPTSIGFGIAIPHCRSTAVLKPFIAFIRTSDDIHWDSSNDEMVDLIFLIGTPETSDSNLHLKYLSNISRKLMHEDFREQLRQAIDGDTAFSLLNQINEGIGGKER